MPEPHFVIAVDVPRITDQCFVAYPFAIHDGRCEPITSVINDAVDQAHLAPYWIERKTTGKDFIATIRQEISQSAMVVAICTPDARHPVNPNVTYELGLADALGKPTLILINNAENLPADLRSHGVLEYSSGELKHQRGKQALADRLAIKIRELQQRSRKARVILDDAPAIHALTANQGAVLMPPFWSYTQEILTYADHLCREMDTAASHLIRLSDSAQALLSGTTASFKDALQHWGYCRQLFAQRIVPALAEDRLRRIEAMLQDLTAALDAGHSTAEACRREFDTFRACIARLRQTYGETELGMGRVLAGDHPRRELLGTADPLRIATEDLIYTTREMVRTTEERICSAFAACNGR
ncbi:hypothetical protein [Opitutus sp. ER46]|uniref:hypothetical protein n=1 Tax=Opitutus sp. ER46 TaxID=2161864 RepID=UPI000D304095|nr:hypothetical protein [Opitutus sp. ER46]PTX94373.1 hypothetical protein DB354_11505 [Opitutus sp. ER46]